MAATSVEVKSMGAVHLIMAAGSGSRLFPMSTKSQPKQFIKLENDFSLLQNTVKRLSHHPELVITTMEKYKGTLASQLEELKLECKFTIIVVPETYNTAYSICAASQLFKGRKIIAIPSDKVFDSEEFKTLMEAANRILTTKPDKVLLFGIKPTYPATGFGYLETKGDQVVRFVEKPCLEEAKRYLETGNYYWNGGMLGFTAEIMNSLCGKHRPDIMKVCNIATSESVVVGFKGMTVIRLSDRVDFGLAIEDISIDYAITERLLSDEMTFLPYEGKWIDIGSWKSVYDFLPKTEEGINKSCHVTCKSYNSRNCLVLSKMPVYLNGVTDLVVVVADDGTIMISHKDKTQDVKRLICL